MVYFAQEVDNPDLVKIGHVKGDKDRAAASKRLSQLQVGNPRQLQIVALRKGTREDERSIHWECSKHHHRGEWFRMEGVVRDHVARGQLDTPITIEENEKRFDPFLRRGVADKVA